MRYEAKIPVNDWKPAPLREDKVNEAVASIVNSDGGILYVGYGQHGTPVWCEKLAPEEIRYICRRFIEAKWHVYLPSDWYVGGSLTEVFVSKLPDEAYNCGATHRSTEILNADDIKF